jgi:hypothetical protein
MAVEILERDLRVPISAMEGSDVAYARLRVPNRSTSGHTAIREKFKRLPS